MQTVVIPMTDAQRPQHDIITVTPGDNEEGLTELEIRTRRQNGVILRTTDGDQSFSITVMDGEIDRLIEGLQRYQEGDL